MNKKVILNLKSLCLTLESAFYSKPQCNPLFYTVPVLWVILVALERLWKSFILASSVSLSELRFQKARRKRKSPFHPRLFDIISERQRGKEMTMLVNNRDRVSRKETGRWIKTCARTHTRSLFLPLYILIRRKLCPELSHIVRNFLSDWQVNPLDMAFADFTPNLDSKTENFYPTTANTVEAF